MMAESEMEAAASPATTYNPLEQFVLLAKSAKGPACAELIRQALEAPGVYVFGELLAMPNVLELENGPYADHLRTLRLFAYGTFAEYTENNNGDGGDQQLLVLSACMRRKLQHLTIVSMTVKSKRLPYDELLTALRIVNVRDLEDLIIDAIYADIVHGKLDQHKRHFEVDYAIGRDVRPGDLGQIVSTLKEWSGACETVLKCLELQIERANDKKATQLRNRGEIDAEIRHIRDSLRTQQNDDEAMTSECTSAAMELRKRLPKCTKLAQKIVKATN